MKIPVSQNNKIETLKKRAKELGISDEEIKRCNGNISCLESLIKKMK